MLSGVHGSERSEDEIGVSDLIGGNCAECGMGCLDHSLNCSNASLSQKRRISHQSGLGRYDPKFSRETKGETGVEAKAGRTGKRPVEEIPGREILRVQVGSRAHGTHTEKSDDDARLIFVLPLEELFVIGNKPKETVWKVDHKDDLTGWEIAHFLKLATQCNPTVLEVMWAPIILATEEGHALRQIRSSLLNKKRILDAFSGYAHNQQKKMLDGGGGTWGPNNWKFATAYLRVLHQGIELLKTQDLPVDMTTDPETLSMLQDARQGKLTAGDVINQARELQEELQREYLRSEIPGGEDVDLSIASELLYWIRTSELAG